MEIKDDYITLTQLLKHFKIISSGGEAKVFLKTNDIFVNGVKDDRRNRKIYPGDTVTYLKETYSVCSSKD